MLLGCIANGITLYMKMHMTRSTTHVCSAVCVLASVTVANLHSGANCIWSSSTIRWLQFVCRRITVSAGLLQSTVNVRGGIHPHYLRLVLHSLHNNLKTKWNNFPPFVGSEVQRSSQLYPILSQTKPISALMAQQPLGGLGLLIVEASRSHSDTHHTR
jgi:hypothetical protein